MRRVQILAITLLAVLVLLIGMGAVACNGNGNGAPPAGDENGAPPGDENGAPSPGDENGAPPPGDENGAPPPEDGEEAEGQPHFTSADGRIEFALDSVERTKVWPAELRDGGSPKQGYDFVVIDVTIVRITDGHVDARSGSSLIDNNGVEYNYILCQWGVTYYDPHDIRSETESPEGAQGTLIFELPENVEPVKLGLAYVFFESWSESGQREFEEERYIDIIFP